MIKQAVISAVCIALALGLTAGSPLFYERPKVLNKVEFSDAGVDGGRIDTLIDISDEDDNITVSSFTDTNAVSGNDSKEGFGSPGHNGSHSVEGAVTTKRTVTEGHANDPIDGSEVTTEKVHEVTVSSATKQTSVEITKKSATDISDVLNEPEEEATTDSAVLPTTEPIPTEYPTEKRKMTPTESNYQGDTLEVETSSATFTMEEKSSSTENIAVDSAMPIATVVIEVQKDDSSVITESTTTSQSFPLLTTTMIPFESTADVIIDTTTITETSLKITNDFSSVKVTEPTTVIPSDDENTTTYSMIGTDSTSNMIASTAPTTTDVVSVEADSTTFFSIGFPPTTDVMTADFTTSSAMEISTATSFSVFSDTTILPITSEMSQSSEITDTAALDVTVPTTSITEAATSTEPVTAISYLEKDSSYEVDVASEMSTLETTEAEAVSTTITTTASTIDVTEFSATVTSNIEEAIFTEGTSTEDHTTILSTMSETVAPETLSTTIILGHFTESETVQVTPTSFPLDNWSTGRTIFDEIATPTFIATERDIEISDTTTLDVRTTTLVSETTTSEAVQVTSTDAAVFEISATIPNSEETTISSTEMFAQDTTSVFFGLTEEPTVTTIEGESIQTTLEEMSTTTERLTWPTVEEDVRMKNTTVQVIMEVPESITTALDLQTTIANGMMSDAGATTDISSEASAVITPYTAIVTQSSEDFSTTALAGETFTQELVSNRPTVNKYTAEYITTTSDQVAETTSTLTTADAVTEEPNASVKSTNMLTTTEKAVASTITVEFTKTIDAISALGTSTIGAILTTEPSLASDSTLSIEEDREDQTITTNGTLANTSTTEQTVLHSTEMFSTEEVFQSTENPSVEIHTVNKNPTFTATDMKDRDPEDEPTPHSSITTIMSTLPSETTTLAPHSSISTILSTLSSEMITPEQITGLMNDISTDSIAFNPSDDQLIKEEKEKNKIGRNISLTSEAMITTTVSTVISSVRTNLNRNPDVLRSGVQPTKSISHPYTPEADDQTGATIASEKELPSTSDAFSTPAEGESGSTMHAVHHQLILILVPVTLAIVQINVFT